MADDDKKDDAPEEEVAEEEAAEPELDEDGNPIPPKKKSKKMLFIICGGVGALALIGIILFLFVFKSAPEPEPDNALGISELDAMGGAPVYKDLEPLNINLLTERGSRFLKVRLTLEFSPPVDDATYIGVLPRIEDDLNMYLRQRRPDDFKGTGNIYKLKEDILLRLGQASHPLNLKNILFRELVVQ